ncbi:MAG: hypothetical protein HYY78_18885 [Betaproteobacteria bacterium]|nr:hypothetical protein [Betaproteobacteria bacterium]
MSAGNGRHPIASVPGASALAAWSLYALSAALYFPPDAPPSALITGFSGLLACTAVVLNFAYWRLVVILAAFVHLSFYAVRVGLMVGMTADLDWSSLLSALSFYYGSSWRVTVGMLQERGVMGGLTHGFLEYAMPVLSLALIGLASMYGRAKRGASQAG